MTVRSGMTELVGQFRSYIQESGTAIFSDDRLQQILDSNSQYILQSLLQPIPIRYHGSVIYTDYFSNHQFIEGTASSTTNVTNLNGTVVTNYTSDFINGRFTFNENQRGTAYYVSGRTYNFFKAVSEGWKEKAAYYSTQFDFTVEGRSYKKSQVVKSCLDMAKEFDAKASAVFHSLDRGDMQGCEIEDD